MRAKKTNLVSLLFGIFVFEVLSFCQAEEIVESAFIGVPNLHVYKKEVGPEQGYKIVAVSNLKLPSLGGGDVFDLGEVAHMNGIALEKGETALYNPYSQVIYFNGRRDRYEMLKNCFASKKTGKALFQIVVVYNDAQRGHIFFKGIVGSGDVTEIKMDGDKALKIELVYQGASDDSDALVHMRVEGPIPWVDGVVDVNFSETVMEKESNDFVIRNSKDGGKMVANVKRLGILDVDSHNKSWENQLIIDVRKDMNNGK